MKKHTFILRNFLLNLLSFLSLGLLVLLWIVGSSGEASILPSPYEVWTKFLALSEDPIAGMSMLGHSLQSLRRVFVGLLAATVGGIPLAVSYTHLEPQKVSVAPKEGECQLWKIPTRTFSRKRSV